MKGPTKPLPLGEFVILLALMISIVAMATDIMLPALSVIGRDLEVARANDVQLVVSSLFAGFALGQLIAGPLSDSYGRKPVIYWGYAVFLVGCLLSVVAADLTTMLIGRICRGSAPRRRASSSFPWSVTVMRAAPWRASCRSSCRSSSWCRSPRRPSGRLS